MRKILEKEDEGKKKRDVIYLGVFLIIIMIFSTLGYAFFTSERGTGGDKEEVEYKGISFKRDEYARWIFEIGGRDFTTKYNPLETENITIIISKSLEDYQNQVLYFGIDSKEDINQAGSQEILINFGQLISRSNLACLTDECTGDYPIKNCTEEEIIIFKEGEEFTRVREEKGCIVIYASNLEVERASDAFLYKVLGI